jgi:tetratricopeptide (TPR) repeat protein
VLSYEWFYGSIKNRWRQVLLFFVVMLLLLPLRIIHVPDRNALATGFSPWALSTVDPLRYVAATIGIYIDNILWPLHLSFYHSAIGSRVWTYMRWYGVSIGLCILLLLSVVFKKKVGFWLSFFFIATSIVILPTTIASSYAERYAYLGAAGIMTLAVYGIVTGAKKLRISSLAAPLLVVLSVVLGTRTVIRNMDWYNERSFIFATVRDSPNNPKAHNMAASVYAQEGKIDEARREFEYALTLSPTYYPAYFNLGLLSEREGQIDEAISFYQKTLELNPLAWEAHQNLGGLYMNDKDYETAKSQFQQAITINPKVASLYVSLGRAYQLLGNEDEANKAFQQALFLDPKNTELRYEPLDQSIQRNTQ